MSTELLISNLGVDKTSTTAITGFTIDGIQPTNTDRHLAFKVGTDTTWYKLNNNAGTASLSALATQSITGDSIASEGNTVAELLALTNIPDFVGKIIYPAVALTVNTGATTMPTLRLTEIKGTTNTSIYTKTIDSLEYTLADTDVSIVSITPNATTTGNATIDITVSLKQNDVWSAYIPYLTAQNQQASAIKYRATYTVTTLDGTDTAKINSVTILHTDGAGITSDEYAEIYTQSYEYTNGLSFAECLVRHEALKDATIDAYVSFKRKPDVRENLQIGVGNDLEQVLTLGFGGTPDTGINHNTIQVYLDGKRTYNFDFNTLTSQITITVAKGVAITVNYEYNNEAEEWHQMNMMTSQIYQDTGYYGTKFEYVLPDTIVEEKTLPCVKVVLGRPQGTVTDYALGTATGTVQSFTLPHYAKEETIVCNGQWRYIADTRQLLVVATQGTELTVSYGWIAELPKVYGLTAGYAE